MANYTELNVYKATYGLLFELLSASKSFNRDFKYTLGENLKTEMIDAMMFIWRANSVYDKHGHIESAREKIEKCRLYIRLLYDLRQISMEHFNKWNIAIQNISKQLAGWDKSQKKEENVESLKVESLKVNRFEELMVWQKAKVQGIEVYRTFENSKDFGFKDQIQRATVSIMNNIAEGFERKGNKEFAHFLFIAKGSCGEVRSMLILANELNKIDTKEFEQLFLLSEEISKMLAGLNKTLLSRK